MNSEIMVLNFKGKTLNKFINPTEIELQDETVIAINKISKAKKKILIFILNCFEENVGMLLINKIPIIKI